MTLNKYTLHDEIDAEQALALWKLSGDDNRKASGFTYKGEKLIARHDAVLTGKAFEALLAESDRIFFWHYGYNSKCSRELDLRIGNANFTIDVECEYTREKPSEDNT